MIIVESCPVCKGDVRLCEPERDAYVFKCESCGFVSPRFYGCKSCAVDLWNNIISKAFKEAFAGGNDDKDN